jgi:hypothetical protein
MFNDPIKLISRYDTAKQRTRFLQTRTVDDLHVNGELTTTITQDQDANGTTAGIKGFLEAGPEAGLIDHGNGLLDVTSLSHGNDCIVLADVEVQEELKTYRYRLEDQGLCIA